MAQILKNNVSGVLGLALGASDTSMTLLDASSFPVPPGGDFYLLTLIGLNTNGQEATWEVVKVVAKAANTLTVVRAQEGTTAAAWPVATTVQLRLTAGSVTTPDVVAAAMTAHTSAADPHDQYLPKVGGTMSGPINFAPAQTWPIFNQSTTGNAGTATKLATARTLTIGNTGKVFDGSGNLTWTLAEIGATGLQYLTESRNSSTPNNSIPVHGVQAYGTETSIDLLLAPKGDGAIVADVPTSTISGGNKRGAYAVDLQLYRSNAAQVASGDYSTVHGGVGNTASNHYSSVVGGSNNSASGERAAVGGGSDNTASNYYSTVGGGTSNVASGSSSTVPGGSFATTNSLLGLLAYGFNGQALGQNQMAFWGGRLGTANATPTRITANALSTSATNQLTLRNNSAFRVRGTVVARNTSTNHAKEWTFEALIKRGANAATTSIVGTPSITSTFADTEAESWDIAISADTTNGALAISATGAASTTIRWTAVVHSIEVA